MGNPVVPQLPSNPPGFVSVADATSTEIDPKIFGKLWEMGKDDANLLPKWIVQIVVGLIKCFKLAISIWILLIDEFLSVLADFFQAAQGNSNPSFYGLVANLLTDLTGIEVGGDRIIGTFQARGRLAAMQEVGGALVDALSGEFAGVFQADKGGVFTTSRGSGIGGLPAVQLSPEQGMNAARAFMGFAMSFAVREGNTDFFADTLPFGIGHAFKNITEDLSKALGLGRLTRLALKPLFQNFITVPATWAFNKQYRPTLLGPGEVIRANIAGLMTEPDAKEELARHGYSDTKQDSFSVLHGKWPNPKEHFLAELVGEQDVATTNTFLAYLGYTPRAVETLRTAERYDLSRRMAFELAHRIIPYVMNGALDLNGYSSTIEALTLSAQEKKDLLDFVTELHSHPRKRLSFAQITTAFLDGIVAIDQVAEYLHDEGYREDDIAILLQIDLFKLKVAKDHAATAAAKAAAKKKPKTPGA